MLLDQRESWLTIEISAYKRKSGFFVKLQSDAIDLPQVIYTLCADFPFGPNSVKPFDGVTQIRGIVIGMLWSYRVSQG